MIARSAERDADCASVPLVDYDPRGHVRVASALKSACSVFARELMTWLDLPVRNLMAIHRAQM